MKNAITTLTDLLRRHTDDIISYTKRNRVVKRLCQLFKEFPKESCTDFKATDGSHSSELDLGKLQDYSRETVRISTRRPFGEKVICPRKAFIV